MTAVLLALATSVCYGTSNFVGPLIYLRSPRNYTLALGLQTFQGLYSTDFHYLMAASIVVAVGMGVAANGGWRASEK